MWQMDVALTVLSLLVVPLMVVVFRLYANRMVERGYAQQEAEGQMYDVLEHTLSSMPVVQAFGAEERADHTFKEWIDKTLAATLATTSVQLQFKVLMGLGTALGTAAILWVGATHVLQGSLSIGSIIVFVSYLSSLYGPLEIADVHFGHHTGRGGQRAASNGDTRHRGRRRRSASALMSVEVSPPGRTTLNSIHYALSTGSVFGPAQNSRWAPRRGSRARAPIRSATAAPAPSATTPATSPVYRDGPAATLAQMSPAGV